MEDLSLRAAFHRALDPIAPPAPWFAGAVQEQLRARREAYRAARARRRGPFALALPGELGRVAAVALILLLILASLAAFFGVNLYIHRNVPVQFPHALSRGCQSWPYVVTPDGVQWRTSTPRTGDNGGSQRSTDGGATWHDVSPPHLQGYVDGADALCIVDGGHAFAVETVSTCTPTPQCKAASVMYTADGGATWRQGESVAIGESSVSPTLDFFDDSHGWLLTDTGAATIPESKRTVYSTRDGGLHWTQLASGNLGDSSALGRTGFNCANSGMVMTPGGDGWITWDCLLRGAQDIRSAPPVVVTHDGGRTWAAAALSPVPGAVGSTCGAQPPVFSGANGAMPAECNLSGAVVGAYRTSDGGLTWTFGASPATSSTRRFDGATVNFADGVDGFIVHRTGDTADPGSSLYATADGGRTWRTVASGLFPRISVRDYDFVDAKRGYAATDSHLWRTDDGGRTWAVLPPYHSVGFAVCSLAPAPPTSDLELASPLMYGLAAGWDTGARHTTDGGAHWTTTVPKLPTLGTSAYSEYYLDGDYGWIAQAVGSPAACSDHVVVYRTIDGGSSWDRIASVTVPPTSPAAEWSLGIDFLDSKHGWLYASTGVLFRTDDGGAHWGAVGTIASAKPSGCTAGPGVHFTTSTDGWLGLHCYDNSSQNNTPGPYRLLVTRDGGATWAVQTVAASVLTYDSVAPTFFDVRHGYIWDPGYSMLAVTSDGGRSWSVRTLPISGYPCVGKGGTSGFCTNDAIFGMSFLDATHGWALIGTISLPPGGKGSGPIDVAYRFVRTSNGGLTWTVYSRLPTTTSPDGASTSLQFIDSTDAYWLNGTKWLVSHDGGRTWALVFTGTAPQ